ncbi:MAG: hypothetical protein IPM25_03320 [Chloracidobacterium sp.]|nr:hypothetical protein [Chloracidobacterium sp.]
MFQHPLFGVSAALLSTASHRTLRRLAGTRGRPPVEMLDVAPAEIESAVCERSPKFRKAAGKVAAILNELSLRRQRFLTTGDHLELYPTFACNMVAEDFYHMVRLTSSDTALLFDVVVTFYDAHEANRRAFAAGGLAAVEPHWRRYFKRAVKLNRSRSSSQADILLLILDGVEAHLADLPRALTHVSAVYGRPLGVIEDEYDSIDPLISQSVFWSIRDIRRARKLDDTRLIERCMAVGANYVIYERRKAWRIAVNDLPMRTKLPQPVLDRDQIDRSKLSAVFDLICFRARGRFGSGDEQNRLPDNDALFVSDSVDNIDPRSVTCRYPG